MLTAIAAFVSVLGTTGIAQWYKKVQASYTASQVQTVVSIVAATIAIIWGFATSDPSFFAWIERAIVLATSSIGTYELVRSKTVTVLNGSQAGTTQ